MPSYDFAMSDFVIPSCDFFFQAEVGIRDRTVTGVQTCALPISYNIRHRRAHDGDETRALTERHRVCRDSFEFSRRMNVLRLYGAPAHSQTGQCDTFS